MVHRKHRRTLWLVPILPHLTTMYERPSPLLSNVHSLHVSSWLESGGHSYSKLLFKRAPLIESHGWESYEQDALWNSELLPLPLGRRGRVVILKAHGRLEGEGEL